jgi:hypothetical protein
MDSSKIDMIFVLTFLIQTYTKYTSKTNQTAVVLIMYILIQSIKH